MTICIDNVCSSIINHGAYVLSQYMDNLYDVEELYTTISKYFNYNFSIEIPEYIITNTYEENLKQFLDGKYSNEELNILCKYIIIELKLISCYKNDNYIIKTSLLKSITLTEDDIVFENNSDKFCEVLDYKYCNKLNYGFFLKSVLNLGGNIDNLITTSNNVFGNIFKYSICDKDNKINVYTTNIENDDIKKIYFTLNKTTQMYIYEQFEKMIIILCNETYYFGNVNKCTLASIYITLFGGIYDNWKNILKNHDNEKIKEIFESCIEQEFDI